MLVGRQGTTQAGGRQYSAPTAACPTHARALYNRGMQNLLHNLNEEQLAAVTLPAQSALILSLIHI